MTYVGYLKKFKFWWLEHEINNFELIVEICLGPLASAGGQININDSHEDTTLKFAGVKSLKFGEIQMLNVVQIELHDVSSHQLEGINLQIVEEENSLFSFVSSHFEIVNKEDEGNKGDASL
jgi:hypothetical protein